MPTDGVAARDSPRSQYPFAAAPDIIRSNQKDVYFEGVLFDNLSSTLRATAGSRIVHKYASEIKTLADLLYLSCTTLLGNRTLGEEYCDIVQIEGSTSQLPSLFLRSGYILSSIALPYFITRSLPAIRSSVQRWLESSLRHTNNRSSNSRQAQIQKYLLDNLPALTSPAPIYALNLTIFYFSGAYYQLSKRLWGLRYLFTKRIEPSDQRIGYEVLGVLLVLQLSMQAWSHVQTTYGSHFSTVANAELATGGAALLPGGIELGLSNPPTDQIPSEQHSAHVNDKTFEARTSTPAAPEPRVDLAQNNTMSWIGRGQQRKCILCLEEIKDPSMTTCGHVFCWNCISDWIKEKPECPLCRQSILIQHVLTLQK